MKKWGLSLIGITIAALYLLLPLPGQATIVDLTTAGATGGPVNGALFTQSEQAPAGSGVLDSFVRIQSNNPTEQGYNTSFRPLQFDENNSPTFTRDLLLSAVPTKTIGGIVYREFALDINQQNANPLLSLDQLQLFVSNTAGNHNYPGGLGTLIYNLDAGTNSTILLNYALEAGSGQADMFAYIPNSAFDAFTNVYLYSSFGAFGPTWINNDGYEEWAVRTPGPPTVPEPASLLLLGVGLLGAGIFARRKMKG